MRKAFTTIEMIIMITLLAVLMVMIVPNFITYLDNSIKSEYESTKNIVETAAQKYIDDIGGYDNLTGNEIILTDAVLGNNDLLEAKYIDDKVIDTLKKYAASGQAGTTTNDTNYFKKVCVDVNAKKVNYSIAENTTCP